MSVSFWWFNVVVKFMGSDIRKPVTTSQFFHLFSVQYLESFKTL